MNLKKANTHFFVSERHFQVAFALALKEKYKNLTIIPEYVFGDYHVDLVAIDNKNHKMIAFEFKYVLNGGHITLNGKEYKFRDHSAQDIRRAQFIYDIYRLEDILSKDSDFKEGYAIILTNMSRIYGKGTTGIDIDFNICQNKMKITKGMHKFKKSGGKYQPDNIKLRNNYPIFWKDYKENKTSKKFKYLSIRISK